MITNLNEFKKKLNENNSSYTIDDESTNDGMKCIKLIDSNANKFYYMNQIDNDTFEVHYGRIGTDGIKYIRPMNEWDSTLRSKLNRNKIKNNTGNTINNYTNRFDNSVFTNDYAYNESLENEDDDVNLSKELKDQLYIGDFE